MPEILEGRAWHKWANGMDITRRPSDTKNRERLHGGDDRQANEPAEQPIVGDLNHQLPHGPDVVEGLQQRAKRLFRRNRRTAAAGPTNLGESFAKAAFTNERAASRGPFWVGWN